MLSDEGREEMHQDPLSAIKIKDEQDGRHSNVNRRVIQRPFSVEECSRIQSTLKKPIDMEHIQFRPSAQGSVGYVEGWKALSIANDIFGFDGWSSEILSLSPDFIDTSADGKVSIGISCMVRIFLRDGTFHDVRFSMMVLE
jgi:DNA repair and recombination protein RAD52